MSTLLKLAEDYYAANPTVCDTLAEEAKAAGIDESALDELIHEGAENEGLDSEEASNVNNAGMALQIASLFEGNGVAEGTRMVREAFTDAPRP